MSLGLVFVILVSSLLNVDCNPRNHGYRVGAGLVKGCPISCRRSELENQITTLFSEVNQIAPSLNVLVSKTVASCYASDVYDKTTGCEKAYDDSTGTRWSSTDDKAWIQFFLANETMLTSCVLTQSFYGGGLRDIMFEFSDNSIHTVTLRGVTIGLVVNKVSFNPVVTSWVNLTYLINPKSLPMNLADVKFY